MNRDLEALWTQLEIQASGRSKEVLRRRLTETFDDGTYIGIDAATQRRVFLIELGQKPLDRPLPRWRQVAFDQFEGETPGTVVFRVTLLDPLFNDVFDHFALDVYAALSPLRRGPKLHRTLLERLDLWRHFFELQVPPGLNAEQREGLFGELWTLREVILPRVGKLPAAESWIGPSGAPQDFVLPGGHLEVKIADDDWNVRISSEFQLNGGGKSLYLCAHRLSTEGPTTTLPELIQSLRAVLDSEALREFDKKLLRVGYLDTHALQYTDAFCVKESAYFEITSDFPRIATPPTGVSRVRYHLALAQCAAYRRSPDHLVKHLIEARPA